MLTRRLIDQAEQLLNELLKFAGAADATVHRFFRAHPRIGSAQRGMIAQAVFTVLRRKTELTYLAASRDHTLTRRLVLLGLLHGDTGAKGGPLLLLLSGSEADWFEQIAKITLASLPAMLQLNWPDWLDAALSERKLSQGLDRDERIQLAAALNQSAPLDLRVNRLKANRLQVLTELGEAGLEARAMPFAPLGIRLAGKPTLKDLPAFRHGRFEVQDEASQLLCYLVAPKRGETVVDFCAGAGGKTLALGALMRASGRLYAFDTAAKRLSQLTLRLAKSGLTHVYPSVIDNERDVKIKRLYGKIDRVLVDAPCSGLGTLRRNPDLKWRQTPESIIALAGKQAEILAAAAQLVKPGGRLVYATCSMLEVENEAVAIDFINTHPAFRVLPARRLLATQKIALDTGDYLSLWPHRHATDGFFAAVFERCAAVPDSHDS
jgi:16S rRNA (cytosine967-C5)-methyltransferase